MPERGRDLVLAGALISIVINPLFFVALDRLRPWLEAREAEKSPARAKEPDAVPVTSLKDHIVVVGVGRVGRRIAEALQKTERPLYVIDETEEMVEHFREQSIEGVVGNAVALLDAANLREAAALIVGIPNTFEAGQVIVKARRANATMPIVARAHTEAEAEHLRRFGATTVIIGEEKIAEAMVAEYRGLEPGRPGAGAA
jgi:CPA2 family monovalent cation:H+ antiporter-2